MTFLEHVIAGDRELNDFWSLDVQRDASSIITKFLYIVRSDKQVNYKPDPEKSTFYHKDATLRELELDYQFVKQNATKM